MWKHVLGASPLMKSGSALQLPVKLCDAVGEIVVKVVDSKVMCLTGLLNSGGGVARVRSAYATLEVPISCSLLTLL